MIDRLHDAAAGSTGARAAADLGRSARGPGLREAASRFEAYLLGQIFSQAAKPLSEKPLLDGSSASRMYRELYLQEVASHLGPGAGLGIARLLTAGSGAGEPATPAARGSRGGDAG